MADLHGQTDQISDSCSDLIDKVSRVHCNNFLAEDGALVVGTQDDHTVEERLEVELLEEGSLRVSDFLSNCAHLELFGDLNLSLFNLGGDLEGVEEVNLGGVETCGSWWDDVVDGGDGSDLSLGGELAFFNLVLQIEHWLVGEDQSDLLLEVGQESLEFRLGGTILFE